MEIYAFNQGMSRLWLPQKLLLIMKLVIIIFIASLMQVSAAGFAQQVSLKEKSASLESVFKKIRIQTGYDFVYDSKLINTNKRVSLDLRNVDLENALSRILDGQGLAFEIKDKVIVLSKKAPSFIDKLVSKFSFIEVSGRVLDETGKPLPGATVKVKGKNISAVTDKNGRFFISGAAVDDILVISYVGYLSTETVVKSTQDADLSIRLKLITGSLEEVTIVNTGYQKLSREKVTGSVTTIGSAELEKRNSTNIMQNLEGLVPGLVQTRLRTTIRGLSSLDNTTREILYVVDGLPIAGNIDQINPYDIETVTVLKDAAAAAIYGARASNGVIVVTTKRAKVVGKTTVEASTNITLTEKPDFSYSNYMTPSQQVDWESNYWDYYFNGNSLGGTVVQNPLSTFENQALTSSYNPITPIAYASYQLKKGMINQTHLNALMDDLRNNNFLDQYKEHAIRQGLIQQYNFAVRTNSGKAQHSLVVNYTTANNGGGQALINSFNKTLNLAYKGGYTFGKWLDVDYGVNSIIGKVRSHNSAFATSPTNIPTYMNLLNNDGSRAYYNTNQINPYHAFNTINSPALASLKFNHLDELEHDYNNTSVINTRYYVNLNIKPMKGLSINPMFQLEDGRSTSSAYSEEDSYTMRLLKTMYTTRSGTAGNYVYTNLLPKGGKLATTNNKSTNYTARVQANYNKEFGKHGVVALIGTEFRQTLSSTGVRGILLGYDDELQSHSTNLVNFGTLFDKQTGTPWDSNYPTRQYLFDQIASTVATPENRHRYGSGYANITYTYDRKYNIFGSARKDYADLFGGDEKYRGRPLWSVGTSWIVSGEDFMKDIKVVDYLKVRASYGLTGNIKMNTSARLVATTGTTNTSTGLPSATVQNPPNPLLRWEKTATANIGADFSMLENRLRGALDFYTRKGTDLFATKRFDPTEGFTSMVINNASMTNKGIELGLSYDWFRSSDQNNFAWSSNMTGAVNTNKVTSVDELTKNPLTLAQGGSFKIGYPTASIFAFKFAGLNATGVPQWYNAAGVPSTGILGVNDADAIVFMGSQDPKYTLSLNNDLSYKNFTLGVFAVYQGGNYFRARQIPTGYPGPGYAPLPSMMLDSWTPTNTDTDIPGSGQFYQNAITQQYAYSDNLVRRADFFRIRNIVLGYDIPRELASKIKAANLKLRFQVNNPDIIWYKQKDVRIDSETSGAPYPTAFVFGLNANF